MAEVASALFLSWGLWLLWPWGWAGRQGRRLFGSAALGSRWNGMRVLVLAGVLFGLATVLRYQSGILLAAVLMVVAARRSVRAAAVVAAGAAVVLLLWGTSRLGNLGQAVSIRHRLFALQPDRRLVPTSISLQTQQRRGRHKEKRRYLVGTTFDQVEAQIGDDGLKRLPQVAQSRSPPSNRPRPHQRPPRRPRARSASPPRPFKTAASRMPLW